MPARDGENGTSDAGVQCDGDLAAVLLVQVCTATDWHLTQSFDNGHEMSVGGADSGGVDECSSYPSSRASLLWPMARVCDLKPVVTGVHFWCPPRSWIESELPLTVTVVLTEGRRTEDDRQPME